MTRSVLVTGATGLQGGAVTRSLLGRGHRVRALTRRPDSASAQALAALGAEVVGGDFDDADSLRQSLKDVDAAFVMGTPFEVDSATEARQGIAVVDAAREAGAGHIV